MNILDHLQIPQFRLVAQIRPPVLDAPGKRPLSKLPAATMLADLYRLGWRTELVLQMSRERAQPLGVEIPLALRQLRDVTPPGVSPLAEDADVARSLRFFSSRPAYRLQRHKCNILLALSALLLALHRYHGLPKSDPGPPCPFRWQT